MQPIHQHNYEAYFLDFLEGNLSKAQEEELHLFLAKTEQYENASKQYGATRKQNNGKD